MFCIKCGKEIKDESSFCSFCGCKVPGEQVSVSQIKEQQNIKTTNTKKKRVLKYIFFTVVTVVLLIVVLGYVWSTDILQSKLIDRAYYEKGAIEAIEVSKRLYSKDKGKQKESKDRIISKTYVNEGPISAVKLAQRIYKGDNKEIEEWMTTIALTEEEKGGLTGKERYDQIRATNFIYLDLEDVKADLQNNIETSFCIYGEGSLNNPMNTASTLGRFYVSIIPKGGTYEDTVYVHFDSWEFGNVYEKFANEGNQEVVIQCMLPSFLYGSDDEEIVTTMGERIWFMSE